MSQILLGHVTVLGTTYRVFGLSVGPNATRYGVRANLALEGPRGAAFFVTDYGPAYRINSVAVGNAQRVCAARPLRGLTREHLIAFLPTEAQS